MRHGSTSADPPCVACGRPPNGDGSDACIGHVPGANGACCGHGVVDGYVAFPLLGPIKLPKPRVVQLGIHGELLDRLAADEAALSDEAAATVRVRRLRPQEIERRRYELASTLEAAFEASPLRPGWARHARNDLPRSIGYPDRHHLLVAETDTGRVAALATGAAPPSRPPLDIERRVFAEDELHRCGELRWLAVAPRFRRQGLAEVMTVSMAGSLGADRLWLAVEKSNTTALHCYRAHGWREVGSSDVTDYLLRDLSTADS